MSRARPQGRQQGRPAAPARWRQAARDRWARLRDRRPGIAHVVDAWQLMTERNANQYAAAITYFSFLALFPLLLLAVSVVGFVLHSDPALQQRLFDDLTRNVPGELGQTLTRSIQTAIDARAGVGIVGLAGVLLVGLGWIGNLRRSLDAVWGRSVPKQNFLVAKGYNLAILAGLGIGMVISLGLTTFGVTLTDQILDAVGATDIAGVRLLVRVLGIALAIAGDMLIFWWMLVRLPRVTAARGTVIKGVALAAIGFEILKIVGTYTIAHTANSPTAGPFAGVLAVLIWIQLVARFLLFASAWMAAVTAAAARERDAAQALPDPIALPVPRPLTPAQVGTALLGAGAVLGAGLGAAATVAVRRQLDEHSRR